MLVTLVAFTLLFSFMAGVLLFLPTRRLRGRVALFVACAFFRGAGFRVRDPRHVLVLL